MKENRTLEVDKNWATNKPFHFFGPCSAESYEQLSKTAQPIAEFSPNSIFRAGIWKPRTRPDSFEGIGEEGLSCLMKVKQEFGLKIATEVASPEHLEQVLKAGVDVVWIGARTTVNPFLVQSIADALKGVDIPVFVKNPINPDLALWIGALERINKAGIKKLGAIHRGFHLTDNSPYRNYPSWNIAVQLKATFPDLPVICDASHISGKPDLIPQVTQKAIDLDMDGLMIETHHKPSEALSDKDQQLTPQQLQQLLSELVFKKSSSSNKDFLNQLELLRADIDKVDSELMDLIAVRMELVKKIGLYKKHNNVTILQVERWKEILTRVQKQAKALGVSEAFIENMYNAIHDESILQQTKIQEDKE